MPQIKTVDAWQKALGLLPVPLRDTVENQERYVLLNGSSGNFCLDLVGGVDPYSQRSAAWSCDVGHYITCVADYVSVSRWQNEAPEKFSCQSVLARIHDFHRYLEKTEPDRSRSIVAHVLTVFHRIRSVVNAENNGVHSLRVLLHLIASAAAGQDCLISEDLGLWGLTPETIEPSQTLSEATWRPLYDDLSGTGRYDIIRLEFDLLLRHASGVVFQEAHLEAMILSSLWLPGLEQPVIIDPKAVPSETGIYFTPPALARTLAEEAIRNVQTTSEKTLRVFDPACGSGELLKECLRLLRLKGYVGHVSVIGWDKSSGAIDVARFILAWEKRAWPKSQIDIEVVQHDATTEANWPNNIDVLIMNPPFKSWELMQPGEKAAVSHIVGPVRKPNLALAFARRAIDILRERGVLAMVAPNSLLEGVSGKDTREAMADKLSPRLIARLGDQSIFARAFVDVGMYVGQRKPAPASETAIVWADSRQSALNQALRGLRRWRGAEVEPMKGEEFSVYVRKGVGMTGEPWLARSYDAWSRYKQVRQNEKIVPAKRVFDVKQGIRLGNDVFVVSKEYVQTLPKAERRFFRPAVMNPSIVDGQLSDAYYVFYPYTDGLAHIGSEKELQRSVPRYYKKYLLPAKAKLKARKTLVRERNLNWWDLLWPRAWQEKPVAKIVSKYFGAYRSFAFDPTGDFVVVVANAWLLKKGEPQQDITDQEVYYSILTYLSSAVTHDLLQYVSVQVSGGQLDLSNKYVGNLPIPNFMKFTVNELNQLTQTGIKIAEGKIERWSEVDELVLSVLKG